MLLSQLQATAIALVEAVASEKSISFGEICVLALFGFLLVFVVLVVIMFIIRLIAKLGGTGAGQDAAAPPAAAPDQPDAAAAAKLADLSTGPDHDPNHGKVPATGSLGELDLHNVDDRTVALLMAIVADQMQAPLNELHFKSIRELEPNKN